MQEENEYAPVDVVEQEETTSEEVNEESHEDTVTLSKSEYSKLKRQAIAYKANKSEKSEVKEERNTNSALSKDDIELTVLAAQGFDKEILDEMKVLAQLRGKSVLEVKNDPIIVAMMDMKEKEEKAKQARLGASKGSAPARKEKSFSAPLSPQEHKALWREQFNK